MHFRIILWKNKITIIKIQSYLPVFALSKILSSFLDTLSQMYKTTSPQKIFRYDCITSYFNHRQSIKQRLISFDKLAEMLCGKVNKYSYWLQCLGIGSLSPGYLGKVYCNRSQITNFIFEHCLTKLIYTIWILIMTIFWFWSHLIEHISFSYFEAYLRYICLKI